VCFSNAKEVPASLFPTEKNPKKGNGVVVLLCVLSGHRRVAGLGDVRIQTKQEMPQNICVAFFLLPTFH
jgi:hypothetical protein